MAESTTASFATVWDNDTQQFHGGQEWQHIQNFAEDFSVTTNFLGTPKGALQAAKDAVETIHHYPSADQEPAKSDLTAFLWPDSFKTHSSRLLLGNGASELIDLVIRGGTQGPFRGGPSDVQYKEYERAAIADRREIANAATARYPPGVVCIVNPNNPTGDYMHLPELKQYIQTHVPAGATVLVDESMQPWAGVGWREDSLVTAHDFIREQLQQRAVAIFIMHSWTKIWSCTGLRLGSVIAPTAELARSVKIRMVPWSVNSMAIAFVSAVVKDSDYLAKTWDLTPKYRAHIQSALASDHPSWQFHGKPFLSWLWIDVGSESVAKQAVELARAAGVPVRHGSQGYGKHSFVRVAVREPAMSDILVKAWKPIK